MMVGPGSMIGEEDAVIGSNQYSTTAMCNTVKASVYMIKIEDFLSLKSSETVWKAIVDKSIWKER
jgi:hypothetical protein